MARLNREYTETVSLFPMFNILICSLGVLIFMLSTVQTLSLGVDKSVSIVPEVVGSSQHNKKPRYIEWDGKSLILHPSKEELAIDDIEKEETFQELYDRITRNTKGTAFELILNQIRENKNQQYLIVLVRPSGFKTFLFVRGYIESLGIDIGYEPVDQDWRLKVK